MHISIHTEHYLSVAFGGILLGIELAIILKSSGCIDGSEIMASIIANKLYESTNKNYSMTILLIPFNIIVYILTFFVIGHDAAMQNLLVYIVATLVIDSITNRFEAIKEITIITKDYKPIVNSIKKI